MEIVNYREKMCDAMESIAMGNDNFAIKVRSSKNMERKSYIFKKNMEEINFNQTYFFPFSKLLPSATSLIVTFSGIVLHF